MRSVPMTTKPTVIAPRPSRRRTHATPRRASSNSSTPQATRGVRSVDAPSTNPMMVFGSVHTNPSAATTERYRDESRPPPLRSPPIRPDYPSGVMPDPTFPQGEGAILEVDPLAKELGERFRAKGFELYLVGGVVRARFLGGSGPELDFATDAKPKETLEVLRGWADRHYVQGAMFGTIGARKAETLIEITTFREEVYPEDERKPRVTFGKDIHTDLSRRDFTINAMAVRLPEGELLDPFGGLKDLAAKRLDTPLDPHVAFSDAPLRMLRAARFVSQP